MKKLILLLILINILFTCEGSIFYSAPAVSETEGLLVNFEISLENGEGNTYVSIDPLVGILTQESIKTAADIAYLFSSDERENCDVFIKFNTSSGHIDGPSAGASITTALYSLINGFEIRKDAIITGGIDQYGFLVPVGGLYEKALIAAKNGFTYLIVPPISVHEKIMLSQLKESYDFYIIEMNYFGDLLDFMLFYEEKEETLFTLEPEQIPELKNYSFLDEELEDFLPVTADMIAFEDEAIENLIIPEGFDSIELYYSSVLNNTNTIMEKGYLFTAANRAFLNYIDISTISNAETIDLNKQKEKVEACLNSIPEVKKTKENYEWVISSELREYWAKEKLNSLIIADELLKEEKYYLFHELMYADAWCKVSISLKNIALSKQNGNEIDESAWEPYANNLISESEAYYEENYYLDQDSHLTTSKMLYNDGKYGASIYDSLYILELNAKDFSNLNEFELNETLKNYSNIPAVSLWGKIYHTQGAYLSNGESYEKPAALEVFNYAYALDKADEKMLELLPKESEEDICPLTLFILLVLPLSLIYQTARQQQILIIF